MVDDIVSNQTTANVRLQTGKLHHAIAAGVEFSRETSENFARTGPTAPTADLFNPNPNDPYPGPITRTGASTKGTADSASAYAFDTVSIGQWEFSGGLRFDRFQAETEAVAVDGVVTPFERTDNAVSWRGGAVYKPRPNGSVYVGYGTSFNPSAEGLALSAATVDARARENALRRGRHQVGRDAGAPLAHLRDLPHREDERAHAGRQSW